MSKPYTPLPKSFWGKTCAVLGLGISNLPLIDYLLAEGAHVIACDKKTAEQLGKTAETLQQKGVTLHLGENYLSDIDADYLFRSPGIRPDEPALKTARGQLTSEMELFFDRSPAPIYAITGSDGKTTTTNLTYRLLATEFAATAPTRHAYIGGNVGIPLLPHLPEMTENDIAVAELSSFQLFTMQKSPTRAVITNVTPNHLNWHRDMEEYIEAKCRIYRGEGNEQLITNAENEITARLAAAYPGTLTLFSSKKTRYEDFYPADSARRGRAIYEQDGVILYHDGKEETPVLKTDDILLPGRHNVENYMAAIALTWGQVSLTTIKTVATTFPGVEHRLEYIREYGGVRYYNSSIDSSPTRTAAALSALKEKPVTICGGYDKHIPFAPLARALIARAKAVVLTGATRNAIFEALKADPDFSAERLPVIVEPDFDRAVATAVALAKPGDTVLLSPACASFDAFPNFEVRGRHFKALIEQLGSDREK